MPANHHLMLGSATKFARYHLKVRAIGPFDSQCAFSGTFVEGTMQPAYELDGCWIAQLASCVTLVDLALYPYVGSSFVLQVAPVLIDLIRQRTLDIARSRVAPLDQITVITVRKP